MCPDSCAPCACPAQAKSLGEQLLNHLFQYEAAKKALRGSLDELAKLSPEAGEVALSGRVRLLYAGDCPVCFCPMLCCEEFR